ncbi:hypothetical protein GGD65_007832 [Bradyrhizobium sp. CIR18]|uniref:hypothetical protein n=1 Tax=Bradyrhizobium sp. CIR18 TaxID=2663839 RepID=UPI0016056F11|nr:hypothetical protein [Bradyrhizobium sp. CIR18]MBB4366758.1 hypothetical protein [Bradyrhizobium sp. CIR18]
MAKPIYNADSASFLPFFLSVPRPDAMQPSRSHAWEFRFLADFIAAFSTSNIG